MKSKLGGDNNLGVIMGVFEPSVQCRGNFDAVLSCKDVLADMPASTEMEVFGPRDTPSVKEVLPQEVLSGTYMNKAGPLVKKTWQELYVGML